MLAGTYICLASECVHTLQERPTIDSTVYLASENKPQECVCTYSVGLCACVHVCVHACVHACVCLYVSVCMCMCLSICMHIRTNISTHLHDIRKFAYVHTNVHTYIRTYVCTHRYLSFQISPECQIHIGSVQQEHCTGKAG